MYRLVIESPLGPLTLRGTEAALKAVGFGWEEGEEGPATVLERAAAELEAKYAP